MIEKTFKVREPSDICCQCGCYFILESKLVHKPDGLRVKKQFRVVCGYFAGYIFSDDNSPKLDRNDHFGPTNWCDTRREATQVFRVMCALARK